MSSANPSPPRSKWLQFRFSLRTLLIAMLVLGLAIAWVGSVWNRVDKQRRIVLVLEMNGNEVYYDYQRGKDGRIDKSLLPRGNAILKYTVGNDVFAYVDTVHITNRSDELNKLLALLPELPRLTELEVSATPLNDESLERITRNVQLKHLSLANGRTTSPAGLARLAALQHLESLSLDGKGFSDANFAGLPAFPKLKYLALTGTTITSAGFAPVAQLKSLEQITIYQNTAINADAFVHLRELWNLSHIDLLLTSVSDEGLVYLRDLKKLRYLQFGRCPVGDAGLVHLAALPDLELLILSKAQVTDAGIAYLAPLKRLHYLSLDGNKITDQSAPVLAQLGTLRYLRVHGTALTEAGLQPFSSLKNLESLDLGPHISQTAATGLQQQLPGCRISGTDASGRSVFELKPTR